MVGKIPKIFLKELYESFIEQNLEYIRFTGEENRLLQQLRESHQSDWQTVELCREIIFENAALIDRLGGQIETYRRQIKEFG